MTIEVRARHRDQRLLTKGLRTQQKIMSAARAAFGRDGYTRSSMATIAVEGGVSRATLYRYFQDKDEVFGAAVEEMFREFLTAIDPRERLDPDPWRQLYDANLVYLRVHRTNDALLRAFNEARGTHEQYESQWLSMRRRFRETFLNALEQTFGLKRNRKLELAVAAAQCCREEFSLSYSFPNRQCDLQPSPTLEEGAEALADVWYAALQPVLPPSSRFRPRPWAK
ncbi:MAG: TetR/AcrR family transcriptional regulator [Dehalococcoidia bacterium]